MAKILLILDFLLPTVFFFLGRRMKGEKKKRVMRESLVLFFAAGIFAPVVFTYFSLTLQAVFSAFLMLLAFAGIFAISYKKTV